MPAAFSILLIDDDEQIAEVLIRAAGERFPEARFHVVQSYQQAVAYLDETRGAAPQLILLDVDLQVGPSGLDFLTRLRQHPQGQLIPTVVLSHLDDEETVDDTYKLGANSHNVKPFTYEEWKDYVKRLRSYWFDTVARPTVWLTGGAQATPEQDDFVPAVS